MLFPDNIGQETIKDANAKRILNLLFKERQLTKQEIAQRLGLSIPTVISNVNDLIAENLVEEAGVGDSTGGRKPVIISFKPQARYSFGVDILPARGRVVLTDLDSKILADESFPIFELHKYEYIFNKVSRIIENMLAQFKIVKGKVLGVGFSLPGTVNEETLILENAPNLGIANVSFQGFTELLNLPVYVENDANAAAFAESTIGVVKDMNNLVYVLIARGIGTGIVIKDHLYKGKNKRAGEFGHMTIVANGKPCNCGRGGCWEVYASERGLLAEYCEVSGQSVYSIDEVFDLVKAGDKHAADALNRYIDYLAIGIQNIILLLDTDYVVLGGEITKYKEQFNEILKAKVFVPNNFYKNADTKLLFSKLEKDASILGASLLPVQTLFSISEKII